MASFHGCRGRRLVYGGQEGGELAAGIGKVFDTRVLLVRVYYHQITYETERASSIRISEVLSESVRMSSHKLLEVGDESLEKRAIELESILGRRPQVKVAVGDPVALIQEVAEETEEPTLVAAGSRGLGSIRRFTLGSISTALLRGASGPVLIVPPLVERAVMVERPRETEDEDPPCTSQTRIRVRDDPCERAEMSDLMHKTF